MTMQEIFDGLKNGTLTQTQAWDAFWRLQNAQGKSDTLIAASWDSFRSAALNQATMPLSDQTTSQPSTQTQAPETRIAALRAQEASPGNVFQQYQTNQPQYGQMSSAGREAVQGQANPTLESYLAQVDNPATAPSYRDWLGAGGQALGMTDLYKKLGQIAGYFDVPSDNQTPSQKFQTSSSMYGGNQNAQDAYLAPLLAKLSPLLRGGVQEVAQGAFNKWQGSTPDLPWLKELARRKGFFG